MATVNLGMLHYVLNHVYGAFVHRTKISPPFFSRGLGVKKNACLREGVFRTPCDEQLLNALPRESHYARVAFLTPKFLPPQKIACVVHLAGTGDHTFERSLRLRGPLLKEDIATMVLESPFYCQQHPMLQRGAKLLCTLRPDFGKMGVCGLSMGGVDAAMIGSLHPIPVATLPFLSPHSAIVSVRPQLMLVTYPSTLFCSSKRLGQVQKQRWVTSGHVSFFLLHNGEFRKAIIDALNRLEWKESSL
ncbi:hypothetical protein SLA2020_114910 [Shorea laevis]